MPTDDAAVANTLGAIAEAWAIPTEARRMPIEIPNKGRDDLARLFATLGFKQGAEIGVKEADYSDVLLRTNPTLHLYSIDPWTVRKDYEDPSTHKRTQRDFDKYEQVARTTLAQHGTRSTILHMKSEDAVRTIADESLDFVYIDGHHDFWNCTHDIVKWTEKVRPGGIVAGHDFARYHKWAHIHVLQVVYAYTGSYGIKPWYIVGRMEEVPGEVRDHARSFFWVRPTIY